VVAAAGNRSGDDDAVSYAPGNDPYVITVGGVDDRGTKRTSDDAIASWSSRGTTQDGFRKPEIVAPGARMVSTMAPDADYLSLCESCVVDGRYFRVGGTSMAAGVVSGAVADILDAHPGWSPDQVKAAIVKTGRKVRNIDSPAEVVVDEDGAPEAADDDPELQSGQVAREIAVDRAIDESGSRLANQGLTPNELIDPATGGIDYNRASWTRASWTEATDFMRASWTRASWTRASWTRASWTATNESCADFQRASWTRASWTDAELDQAFDECLELARSRDDLSEEEAEALRASWTRASWTRASWTRASWTRASWTRASWTRASWTRASWTRASWTASFHK
jgi:serine protease AprX